VLHRLHEQVKIVVEKIEESDKHYQSYMEQKDKLLNEIKTQIPEAPKAEEEEMKKQLAEYRQKFEDFQNALTKSNEDFTSFREEMKNIAKNLRNAEKDNLNLKNKKKQSQDVTNNMAAANDDMRAQLATLKSQSDKLQELIGTLQ
jgi:chromosome segregation ATPase